MCQSTKFTLCLLLLLSGFLFAGGSWADSWSADFERICSYTDSAPELSSEQLSKLIEESDVLLANLPAKGNSQQKIKVFRLQKCRNLFRYLLDLRETGSR